MDHDLSLQIEFLNIWRGQGVHQGIEVSTFVSIVTGVLISELLTNFFLKNVSIVFRLLIILLALRI